MTATKKSLRFLTVFALIFAMVISMAGIPASAAGIETWYPTENVVYENTFLMNGYNITPKKTIGVNGKLAIFIDLTLTDTSTNSNPAIMTYEIRTPSGQVLDRDEYTTQDGTASGLSYRDYPAGQEIHLYIGIYDSVTGKARQANVTYAHKLIAI